VQWWREAVFYQVYVPSFTDSDGDGVGDLQGVRSRLGYLELLGVDALSLGPIHPAPEVDGGDDLPDPRAVDPEYGDLDAFDALVEDAHAHGIRVTVDLPLSSPAQPDPDRVNLEVRADLDTTLRFWLDRGVDGVRVHDAARLALYVRPDELHLAVDARLTAPRFDADEVRAAVEGYLHAVGAAAAWTLSDHDTSRPASRYGGGATGTARARAMALVALALPGVVYLYNGEELGLPDADLPADDRRNGVREPAEHGRDGSRVPQPWEDGVPAYGFTTGTPWLPIPDSYAPLSAATQLEDAGSTLSLYRRALELRRAHPGFVGAAPDAGLEWFGAPPGCLAFRRAGTTLVCALNTSSVPVPLPPGTLLLASGPLDDGTLPPDTAAWLA
jgi:alpha-glucosidase